MNGLKIKRNLGVGWILGVALCGAVLGAGCQRAPGGDPERVVPADAVRTVVVGPLSEVQEAATAFLAGVEGASGVLDLVADRFGLDLRTTAGLEAAGLDGRRGLTLHTRALGAGGEAVVVAASVADEGRFMEAMGGKIARGLGGVAVARAEAPKVWRVGAGQEEWALGVTEDRVGVLVVAPAGEAQGAWRAVAGQGAAGGGATPAAEARLGQAPLVRFRMENPLPDAPESLGIARGFVQELRDGLERWQGAVALDADHLQVALVAGFKGADGLPVAWVTPEGSADGLTEVLPKTTIAALRLRVNLAKIRKIPSFLRDRFVPERIPGLEGAPLPSVGDLMEFLDGDVVVALLGLAPEANLATLLSQRTLGAEALKLVHFAWVAKVREVARLEAAFGAIASQLETSGWAVAAIEPGPQQPYRGWSFVEGGRHFTVLIEAGGAVARAIFIAGAGEVDAFLAVRAGEASALTTLSRPGVVARALGVGEEASAVGGVVNPLRLVRELDQRGAPPYFLKIVNDIRMAAVAVGATDKEVRVELQVDLR